MRWKSIIFSFKLFILKIKWLNISNFCNDSINYDYYILCSSGRFHETDLKLAKKIASVGKDFYFVRTKYDQDIFNAENDSGRYLNEKDKQNLSNKIKRDILSQLSKENIQPKNVLVLSALMSDSKMIDNRKKYDFPQLQFVITNSTLGKPSMLNSFPDYVIEIINAKTTEISSNSLKNTCYW
jgi:hypothetical protein